jgi:signal transduction histidine kinase
LVLALVVALGAGGTAMAALGMRHADQDRLDRAMTQQTMVVSQVVGAEVRRYSSALSDLAAAVGAQKVLQAGEFAAIVSPLTRQRLPGATGMALVVPGHTAQIPDLQKYWRAHGSKNLVLTPAPGTEHRFVVLTQDSADGAPSAPGRDLAAAEEPLDAMRAARNTHSVATSRTYHLLRDANLPQSQQQLAFVLAAPIYSLSPKAADLGKFRGWLVMGMRAGDFMRDAIGVVARDTVSVSLSDPTSDRSEPVARWQPHARPDTDTPPRDVRVAVPQRTWMLRVQATDRLLPSSDQHLELTAWLVGAVTTLLLAALTNTVLTSRDRALRRVDDATAALRDDIVRREAVEHQLRQRESELVGFAGVVAHDLRSPLARITGYADFLREEAAPHLEPVHRDFLERLYGGAQRMQSLIDDLLDYATADNRVLNTAAVDLHQLADDVLRERTPVTGEAEPITFIGTLPVVDGDPTLLRQVLDNLIGNALKYTPYGTSPYVRIAGRLAPDGRSWLIEVADHGIGIPEEQRETVFTAFTRAGGSEGYPGTGLGLAIVHRIVERHGGTVGVDPNPGGGSVFWFTLPALLPSAQATDDLLHAPA